MVLATRPGHAGRSGSDDAARSPAGLIRPLPRTRLTPFASGVQSRTKYVARPGTISAVGSAASRPAGVDGSPSSADVRDADLHDRVRVGHRDAGQTALEPRIPARARCPCRRHGRCGSRPSRPNRRCCAIDSSLRIEPRIRSNGCGRPDQPALLARRGDRLDRRQPGRDRLLEEHADQVAVPRLHLFPDDHRQPSGRHRPGLERHIDPVMVGDRKVRQPAGCRRFQHIRRRRQAVEAPFVWQCRSMNARISWTGGWRPARRAHRHR